MNEANGPRRSLNVKGLGTLDIRTLKPIGDYWDFTKQNDRREARNLANQFDPDLVSGSPPCTPFGLWSVNLNFKRMDQTKTARMIAEGANI